MSSSVQGAASALRNVYGGDVRDPGALRRRALQVLSEHAGADVAFFFSLGAGASGQHHYRNVAHVGESSFCDWLDETAAGGVMLSAPGLRITRPSPFEMENFTEVEARVGGREGFESSQACQAGYVPHGIDDEIRLMVYHGPRFVGWIGACRGRGTPRFDADARRHLKPLVAPVRDVLTAADELQRVGTPEEGAHFVVRGDGRVQYASSEASAWLDLDGFGDELGALVRAFDRRQAVTGVRMLRWAEASVVRLDGEAVAYLVSVRRARDVFKAPDAALSPTQREVAGYAAAGATVEEIARTRGCSPNTVRTHLKAVYERLGVGSRVELAEALRRGRV